MIRKISDAGKMPDRGRFKETPLYDGNDPIIERCWHYRYVGKDAAAEMYRQSICLEEYLEQASR